MATSTTTTTIQLQNIPVARTNHNERTPEIDTTQDSITIQQLKPADGGHAAWRVLVSAFVFEALLWGFPVSFGVFQNYYTQLPEFKGNSNVALIGTICQGLSYLGAPLSAAATKRFPKYQRIQIYIGWPICIGGLVAGSFTNTLGGLIATQGVMYGIGFITLTYPIISMVDEWWVARKGMAFGLISAASGASGAVMPFIIEAMLQAHGHKTTLRAIAVAMTILTAPLIPFLQGRLPPAQQSSMAKTNWSFLRKPLFWIFCTSTFLYGLGFFFPPLYLPSFAADLGLSSTQGALLLAVMSISQVAGQFFFGYLSDTASRLFSVSALSILCSLIASVACLTLWGLAKSLAPLLLFSIVYGIFGYGFTAMRMAMGKAVSEDSSAAVATYAILVFVQGIGNILAGPVSGALLVGRVDRGGFGVLRYSALTILMGVCLGMSAVVVGLWHLRPKNLNRRGR